MNKCTFCGTTVPHDIIPSNSWFFPNGKSNICYSCAANRINPTKLDEMDRLCQHLNVPFEPNEWNKIRNRNEPIAALRSYISKYLDSAYAKLSWEEQSDRLIELAEAGLQDTAIDELSAELHTQLRKEWGNHDDLTLQRLEALFCNSLSDYDIRTTQQRDLLKKMTRVSILVDGQLETGSIDKDTMKVYNDLLAAVAKQIEIATGGQNITALGQLIEFIERNGFKPNPQIDIPLDEIDMMEQNMMDYARMLVSNDPAIADIYENRKRMRDSKYVENSEK